jgi:hypothetical protein
LPLNSKKLFLVYPVCRRNHLGLGKIIAYKNLADNNFVYDEIIPRLKGKKDQMIP